MKRGKLLVLPAMGWLTLFFALPLLIVVGVSLDIFAAMECQGSLVVKINKKHLSGICVIVAIWQMIALFAGHFLSTLYCQQNPAADGQILGEIISMLIFIGLGIRLLVKAIQNERVGEHLETNLGIRRFVRMASVSSIYTNLDYDCCADDRCCNRRDVYRISSWFCLQDRCICDRSSFAVGGRI